MTGKHSWLLFPVVLLLICLCWGCSRSVATPPLARQGVLDLGGYDRPVRLDGEWEFYWNRLLTPEDFRTSRPPVASGFFTLPGAWNGVILNGEQLGGTGFATFRLRILPGPKKHEVALHFVDLNSAYRLWANGTLLAEGGVVGRNAAEEIPNQSIRLPRLSIGDQPVELLLQVSNHHYREGGVVSSIEIGPAGTLETAQMRQWGLALFCCGSLMVMGIYHLVLFCFRRKNRATLYFGAYSLVWGGYSLTSSSNGWVVRHVWGAMPVWLLNRLDLLCIVISVPIGYSFFRTLYPEEFSRRIQHLALVVASAYTVLGLLASTMWFTSAFPAYYLFSALLILYCLAMLFRAVRRQREGALFIFLGFVALGCSGINDMLCDLQLIRSTYLVHAGLFVFILFQALALSLRFSRAFSAVEKLSGELTDKNRALEVEMVERNRLEREIVNVCEEERRRISHDLHDGLCQQLIGARLHFSVLERNLSHTGQNSQELMKVSSLLDESVNRAYDLSRGLWPVEHDPGAACPSLELLTRRLAESSGIDIEFSQDRTCDCCSNGCLTQLYRIAQEAITNAVKHSRASRIVVDLNCQDPGSVTLRVQDNGVGRSPEATTIGGMGMGIMSHRARIIDGTLTVDDAEGGGTLVTCIAPCEIEQKGVDA